MTEGLAKIIDTDFQEEKITLENFVETYIEAALDLAQENPSLEEFDFYLRKKVSKLTNLSHEAVKYLHNSFHWTFFIDQRDKDFDSPFEWNDSEYVGESPKISLSRFSLEDVDSLSNHVFKEYDSYLTERWNILSKNFNISPREY